jgi:hypothetical protein
LFRFRRDNLQDDVRETQAATQRGAFVQSVISNLKMVGKQPTTETILELLSGTRKNIEMDDIEDVDLDLQQTMQDPMNPNYQNEANSSGTAMKSRVSRDRMASKMRTASNNGVSS